MKKYRILLMILVTIFIATFVATCFVACDLNGGKSNINGTYYMYRGNTKVPSRYFVLKNGTWKDESDQSGRYEVNGNNIMLYIEFFGSEEEYLDGTVGDGVLALREVNVVTYYCKDGATPPSSDEQGGSPDTTIKRTITYDANGGLFGDGNERQTEQVDNGSKLTAPTSPSRTNYTFAGWSKKKNSSDMWKFDTDTVTDDTTLYAQWTQKSAVVLSVDGASMENETIYMFVEHDVDSVPLTDKVVCSDDSTWKLYYDKMGQQPIPTKVAAQMNGFLNNGSNVFYILVSSQNGAQENLYELTIYRSFEVPVRYYDGLQVIQTDSCYTGHEYVADYTPNITGYTFNYWTNDGVQYQTTKIWGALDLTANKTAKKYDVTFDVNKGNALSEQDQSKTVTYDSAFDLPVPTRTGYSFTGWYSGSTQITKSNGSGLVEWNIPNSTKLTAHWQANEYDLSIKASNSSAGTVTGGGTYAYDSTVTLTAETNNGYTWVGWFDGDTKLSDQLTFKYTMGFAKTITAKWSKATITRNNTSAGSVTSLTGKYLVGDTVTVTASTNVGYTWVGWFNGTKKLTDEYELEIEMTDTDITYTAKWSKVTLTVNNSSAGSVSALSETYKVGDKVQITATTVLGYTFVGWYKDSEQISTELQYTITTTDTDVTYTATWSKVTVVSNNSSGGTVSKLTGTYRVGDQDDITATPRNGYTFVGWYNGESKVSGDLTYQVTMTDTDVTYTAHFIRTVVKTAVNNNTAGSVTALDGGYTLGQKVVVTATTNPGYTWVGWFNGTEKLTDEYEHEIEITDNAVTYTAKWSKVTLKVDNSSAGSVSVLTETYKVGDEVQITATTNPGYTFVGWYKDSEQVSKDLHFSITMTDSDVTYTAQFEIAKELENFIYKLTPTTCEITGVRNSAVTEITIPEYVTSIGKNAFSGCTDLATVNWNAINCTSVGTYSFSNDCTIFRGCANLATVNIGANVTFIPAFTFYKCSYLTTVTFDGESLLQTIGGDAFRSCSGLQEITIPASVTSIGEYAFYNCSSLQEITIPQNVTSIGDNAFENCTNLATVNWNAINCTSVGMSISSSDYTIFKGCTHLAKVNIGANVTAIPWYTFYNCSNLETVTFANGSLLQTIGESAFYKCSSLQEITIPASVTSIGEYAFYGCSGLQEIIIPENVTSIGDNAFVGCDSLQEITIPASVTSLDESAFDYCSNLATVTFADGSLLQTIGDSVFRGCTSLQEITIPASVTSIGICAFADCSGLREITIPASVTSIGGTAFYKCSSLNRVNITDIGAWCNIDFGSYDANPLSNGAELYCDDEPVTSLTIPASVTSIGSYVFYGYRNLNSVTFEQGSLLQTIGFYAFNDCTSLQEITIPASVTSIGEYAFDDCSSLQTVYYGGTSTQWEKIQIRGGFNYRLTGATRYYYSADKPDGSELPVDNYWRYVDGKPTVWKKEDQ